jgi:hypothetical protein
MNVQASFRRVLSRGSAGPLRGPRCRLAGGRLLGARPGRPQHLAAAAAVLAAVALAACSGSGSLVTLPAKPDAATHQARAGRSAPATPREQVIAAYDGYNNAVQQAQDSRSAARVAPIMAAYVPASSVQAFVTAFRGEWARGEIGYGTAISHILHVRMIGGSEAVVDDCLNTAHSGLAYLRTGTVVPGTLGIGHDNLATTMLRRHGRWLVSTQTPVEVPCAY